MESGADLGEQQMLRKIDPLPPTAVVWPSAEFCDAQSDASQQPPSKRADRLQPRVQGLFDTQGERSP